MEIFFGKSHDILQDFRISSVLIGWFSGHMTENVKKLRKKQLGWSVESELN